MSQEVLQVDDYYILPHFKGLMSHCQTKSNRRERLEKNNKMYEDYVAFINDIISKRYVNKVDHADVASNTLLSVVFTNLESLIIFE